MSKAVRFVTAPTTLAVANLVRALQRGQLTMPELAAECGLNLCTVQRYCAAFYRTKACYIAAWKQDARGANTIRVYCLGEGVDAVAKLVDKKEQMRRWRRDQAALRAEFEASGTVSAGSLARVAATRATTC